MSQTIITKCDICQKEGDHFPSWFSIEKATMGIQGVGNGLVQTIYDDPKVNYTGWMRYEKFVDLCNIHRDKIIEAIQKIIEAK